MTRTSPTWNEGREEKEYKYFEVCVWNIRCDGSGNLGKAKKRLQTAIGNIGYQYSGMRKPPIAAQNSQNRYVVFPSCVLVLVRTRCFPRHASVRSDVSTLRNVQVQITSTFHKYSCDPFFTVGRRPAPGHTRRTTLIESSQYAIPRAAQSHA